MAFGSMAPEIYYDPMTGLPITQPEAVDPALPVAVEPQGKLSRAFGSMAFQKDEK